jgi:hypothetical protein
MKNAFTPDAGMCPMQTWAAGKKLTVWCETGPGVQADAFNITGAQISPAHGLNHRNRLHCRIFFVEVVFILCYIKRIPSSAHVCDNDAG